MENFDSCTDINLLAAVKAGNSTAFRALYDRYWKPLYTRACKNVDSDEAKDMLQEIMVSLWNRRHDIQAINEEDLSKYLFTALKYRTLSHYAYTSAQLKKADNFEAGFNASPENLLESKELRMLLDSTIESMPGRMQLIFKMSRDEHMVLSDIAIQLNISEQTVKNQLTQALKRLRLVVLDHRSGDWVFSAIFMLYAHRK
ncbi:RNA polymerase sigma-70 factor, ECF subfamily [Mucilaginibacter pineti]|uniref:RNA polymerase sigma-70 factor, ECF subfamily n=1 Tax=Mucilaginibacter pineti TaxID=1391627 RepID=A0A1G6ZUZ0_9SPHI|nr:sigma-70 family RNA polymerase sigma factor [Mucilaginibacter pineti]SDE06153.1 RNA polymerase sigma-70 factor, ECF subfamily [Mucilaginibacter pineti]